MFNIVISESIIFKTANEKKKHMTVGIQYTFNVNY